MIIRKYNIHICYFTKLSLAYQIKFVLFCYNGRKTLKCDHQNQDR